MRVVFLAILLATTAAADDVRAAAARGLALVQSSVRTFQQKHDCASCHHNLLPFLAIRAAHEHGIRYDVAAARESARKTFEHLRDVDRAIHYTYVIDPYFDAYVLVAADAAGIKPNTSLAAYARMLASRQQPDGRWDSIDARPPQAHGSFSATAVAMAAIQKYLPERLAMRRHCSWPLSAATWKRSACWSTAAPTLRER